MNRLMPGIPDFAKVRRALLASLLGLGLVALCPSVVVGKTRMVGPSAVLDSATDDGDGKIRVSWSLQEAPADHVYANPHPEKVCVRWAEVENGERGSTTDTCFISEASTEADLVVDTGIGGDGPSAVYAVKMLAYYYGIAIGIGGDGYTNVTLNDEDGDETDGDETDGGETD